MPKKLDDVLYNIITNVAVARMTAPSEYTDGAMAVAQAIAEVFGAIELTAPNSPFFDIELSDETLTALKMLQDRALEAIKATYGEVDENGPEYKQLELDFELNRILFDANLSKE